MYVPSQWSEPSPCRNARRSWRITATIGEMCAKEPFWTSTRKEVDKEGDGLTLHRRVLARGGMNI
jgi:hypothetical protein